jgi:O-antigen/teichoic acid export membrane protein
MVSMLGVQPFLLIWEAQSYEIAKRTDAKETFSRIFTYWSAILIVTGFFLSLFIHEIFDILVSRKFGNSYLMVAPIAAAYVIQGIGIYFEAGLLIQKKSKLIATIGVICTIFCLAMEMGLIYFWHSWGACISTVLSFIVFGVVTYRYSQREYPFQCDFLAVTKLALLAILFLVAGWMLPIQSTAWRLMAKALLAIVFAVAMLKSSIFPRQDLLSLQEMLPGWARRQLVPKLRWAGLL